MAIASSIVLVSCLMMIGAAYLIFANIDNAFLYVNKQNVVVAFVEESCTGNDLKILQNKLEGLANVVSVEFLSKEEQLERFRDAMPKTVYESMKGEVNPILDCYVIHMRDMEMFSVTLDRVRLTPNVEDVRYSVGLAEQLSYFKQMVWTVGSWVVGVLLMVSLFIISNTIKLTLYSRRLEIYIMKSVGATNGFIRIPFLVEGVVIGMFSGVVAYTLLKIVYTRMNSPMDLFGTGLLSFDQVSSLLLPGFLIIGAATGLIGSAISMGRYLRKQGGISEE